MRVTLRGFLHQTHALYKAYLEEDRVKAMHIMEKIKVKAVCLQSLRCEFDNLKMKELETVEDFYNRVITMVNQMRLNGESLHDKRVVEKILRNLTKKFEKFIGLFRNVPDFSIKRKTSSRSKDLYQIGNRRFWRIQFPFRDRQAAHFASPRQSALFRGAKMPFRDRQDAPAEFIINKSLGSFSLCIQLSVNLS
ncbi:hypothetical protein OSB04_027546 [Centaurea solstitialis]|uniref:Gag-pol polyprotein n=1 Tax=Centaurea solstitialis TaxID=347529 RepID=A0AA38W6Y4_9ASTR|nr:hypothetical protein OSB04_027546 [Centaurea solstitialis]